MLSSLCFGHIGRPPCVLQVVHLGQKSLICKVVENVILYVFDIKDETHRNITIVEPNSNHVWVIGMDVKTHYLMNIVTMINEYLVYDNNLIIWYFNTHLVDSNLISQVAFHSPQNLSCKYTLGRMDSSERRDKHNLHICEIWHS